jgi:prefoldin subunit 5
MEERFSSTVADLEFKIARLKERIESVEKQLNRLEKLKEELVNAD